MNQQQTDAENQAKADDRELADAASVLGNRPGSKLPPEAEAEIEKARIQNLVVAAIAGCSWGKGMSSTMRRAYADYCRRYDVDPVTEMDNLGGSVYVNADWYKRKLGELRLVGIVKDYFIEHIHADPRLDALRKDQSIPEELRKIAERRWFDTMMRRITHNAPEDAEAVAVCTIILPSGSPIVGCKWAGNGTSVMQPRHNGGSAPNPIAEANATLYAETSCIRRAATQLFSHLSGQRLATAIKIPSMDEMESEIEDLGERVEAATVHPSQPERAPAPQLLQAPGYDEVAAFETANRRMNPDRDSQGRPIAVVEVVQSGANAAQRRTAEAWSRVPDPFEEPNARTQFSPAPDVAPVDPANPTPFDPEPAADVAAPAPAQTPPVQSRPAAPHKPCMACGQMVTGPNTPEHAQDCLFYSPS